MFIQNKLFLIYILNILTFILGIYFNNITVILISFIFIMTLSKQIKKLILNNYHLTNNDEDEKIEILTI
jgi:hypothetical protein